MNIVHVLFIVNKIRGERERERCYQNDYKDLWILYMCFIINKMRERGGGYPLNVLKSILKVSLIC